MERIKINAQVMLCFLLISLQVSEGYAQDSTLDDGGVQDAEIVIEKERKIRLAKQRKLYEYSKWKPTIETVNFENKEFAKFEYDVAQEPFDFQPQKVKREAVNPSYRHHVTLGFGNYLSPLLDLHLQKNMHPNATIGFNMKHLSNGSGVKGGKNSASGITQTDAYGLVAGDRVKLIAKLSYLFNRAHFYGYDDAKAVNLQDIRHDGNFLDTKMRLSSIEESENIDFELGVGYRYYSDNREAQVNILALEGAVNFSAKIFLEINSTISKNKNMSQSRYVFNFKSYYHLIHHDWSIDLGISVGTQSDQYHDMSTSKFFPYVSASYAFTKHMAFFAKLEADYQANTLYGFAEMNSYLNDFQTLYNSDQLMMINAGIKGMANRKISYRASVAFRAMKNMVFFINDNTDQAMFDIAFDSLTTQVFHFHLEGRYQLNKGHQLRINSNLYKYTSNGYNQLYHRPNTMLSLGGTHDIVPKLNLQWAIQFLSGIYARNTAQPIATKLETISNVDLSIHYQIKEQLGLFVAGYNLMHQPNLRWQYYQSLGINAKVGVSFRF